MCHRQTTSILDQTTNNTCAAPRPVPSDSESFIRANQQLLFSFPESYYCCFFLFLPSEMASTETRCSLHSGCSFLSPKHLKGKTRTTITTSHCKYNAAAGFARLSNLKYLTQDKVAPEAATSWKSFLAASEGSLWNGDETSKGVTKRHYLMTWEWPWVCQNINNGGTL